MNILIVEDDFISRRLMQKYLESFGKCEVAVNGSEAVKAFLLAHEEKKPFDLILLDIMLPELDGQDVLKKIRSFEERLGILGLDGVKIIMTTALGDNHSIMNAFRKGCEAYIVKPVLRPKLLEQIVSLGLLPESVLDENT